jgi:dTDP-4-amino-4,6-dideoxygalactose transaminase
VCSAEFSGTHLPVTEAAAQTVLTLPCFPTLSNAEVDLVAQTINDWNGQ